MNATVHSDDNGRLHIAGALDFDNVPALLDHIKASLPDTGTVALDLAEVAQANSAALALLVGILREARTRGLALTIEHLPDDLATIARATRLHELLFPS